MAAPTWILLRGLMREQRHWGDFPAALARAVPDAAIVTPDLPGNGQRHRLRSATRVADTVESLRAELAARGLAPPYRLLALSLGGMVAVEWASRYPREVAGCVLINTSMRPHGRFYQRLRWQNYPAVLAQLLLGGTARQESLVLRLTSRDAAALGAEGALARRWIAWQRQYPVSRANALRQLCSAARFRAPARRPPVPLLILASAGDRLVDHGCSLRLAQAWQASCVLHPDAGHDLPLDAADWVARETARWLARPD